MHASNYQPTAGPVEIRGATEFYPLPRELWEPACGDGLCSCQHCDPTGYDRYFEREQPRQAPRAVAYWDTLAVSLKDGARWTVHAPELSRRYHPSAIPIRFTPEHGDSNVAPASYWLTSWRNDSDAEAAIRQAMAGNPSRFMAPDGVIYVTREG